MLKLSLPAISKSISSRLGISMIEVMIAVAIIALGILTIVKIFPLSLQIGSAAEQNTKGTNLAQAQIEYLFSQGYENLTAGTIEPRHRLSNDSQNPFYQFERQTIIELLDGNLNTSGTDQGLKRAVVTVYWKNSLFLPEKNIELKILIAKNN